MRRMPTLLPSWTDAPRAVVGVCPRFAFHQRQSLFHALQRVFPADFVPRSEGEWRGLQAAIIFGRDGGFTEPVGAPPLPIFSIQNQRIHACEGGQMVRFTEAARLDPMLRGARMESVLASAGLAVDGGGDVDLAAIGDRVVWRTTSRAPRVDNVVASPAELEPGGSVRDQLRGGRYLQLLPLFDFLRALTGHRRPDGPVRATFIIDDPNLHWISYGYVGFRSLAAHARANRYHVTLATVPLDCWFAWPSAARIFRTNSDVMSLTSHGVYHLQAELAAGGSSCVSSQMGEAAARLDRFAHRCGVPVGRVMVPPHNESALSVHGALVAAGFEALCTKLDWWVDWPDYQAAIAGIAAADISPSGLPIFARHSLPSRFAREDALISAYLGQPVVWYLHPQDLSDGYDLLEGAASWLRSTSPTNWMSLERIARTNMMTHLDVSSATLHVRALNRRLTLTAPAGALRARIEGPGPADCVGCVGLADGLSRVHPTDRGWQTDALLPCEGGRPMEVMIGDTPTDDSPCRPTAAPLRAYVRRAAVETRDRVRPILRQVGLEPLTVSVEDAFHARRAPVLRARQ